MTNDGQGQKFSDGMHIIAKIKIENQHVYPTSLMFSNEHGQCKNFKQKLIVA